MSNTPKGSKLRPGSCCNARFEVSFLFCSTTCAFKTQGVFSLHPRCLFPSSNCLHAWRRMETHGDACTCRFSGGKTGRFWGEKRGCLAQSVYMPVHASPCVSMRLHATPCLSMPLHAVKCVDMRLYFPPPESPCFPPRNHVHTCIRHAHAMYTLCVCHVHDFLGGKQGDSGGKK